jgi:hypothetical protein
MDTVFVFDPNGNRRIVGKILDAGVMPVPGLRYVASITGPYKTVQVMTYEALSELGDRLDSLPGGGGTDDPPTAVARGNAKVRKSRYAANTAFVMMDVRAPDPSMLMDEIEAVIGSDDEGVEADVVEGDFDILACIVDEDRDGIRDKILALRGIQGVRRTVTLNVIDYVSTSPNAPDERRVQPAE